MTSSASVRGSASHSGGKRTSYRGRTSCSTVRKKAHLQTGEPSCWKTKRKQCVLNIHRCSVEKTWRKDAHALRKSDHNPPNPAAIQQLTRMCFSVHPGTPVEEAEAGELILDIHFASSTNTKMFELYALHFYSNSLLTLKHLLKIYLGICVLFICL